MGGARRNAERGAWYTNTVTSDVAATGASSALPPLGRSTTRSDLVAASLKTAILSGRLKPDEVLVERRIAELLGVSKTPVREALIALTSSGLLTPTRNRGVAVRRMNHDDVRRVYEMRLLVEPWAAGQVASSGGFDPTDARHALADAARFLETEDHVSLSMANRRFHRTLYSTCDNALVVAALDDLQDMTALAVVSLLWERWPTWHDEAEEHGTILDAVDEGRATEAEELLRRHIQRSITRLDAVRDLAVQATPGS